MLVLMAILGALCLAFIGLAARAAVKSHSLGARSLWIFLILAIVFAAAFYIVQNLEPRRGDIPELIATAAAYALVAFAAIAALRGFVPVLQQRSKRRIAVSIGALAATSLILVGAYFARMSVRMSREGWWAGTPTWMLIHLRSSLPSEALGSTDPTDAHWSLLARDQRNELTAAQHERLIDELKVRFRTTPSDELLGALYRVVGDSPSLDPLARVLFEAALNQFCDTQNAEDRDSAARVLWEYLPTHGKIAHPDIGATEGPRVSKGRVPRLIELTHNSEWIVWRTAVDLLAVCGDDAHAALPRLLEIAHGTNDSDRFAALLTCMYLAQHATKVRQLLIVMLDSPDPFEQLFAIEALDQWTWQDPAVIVTLQRLSHSLRPEVAVAARKAIPQELR